MNIDLSSPVSSNAFPYPVTWSLPVINDKDPGSLSPIDYSRPVAGEQSLRKIDELGQERHIDK